MGIFKKDHSIEKLPKPVYYVESSDDTSVLVGIDVTINYLNNGSKKCPKIIVIFKSLENFSFFHILSPTC